MSNEFMFVSLFTISKFIINALVNLLIMLELDSNDLSLGFIRVLSSFRETIAIILRYSLQ